MITLSWALEFFREKWEGILIWMIRAYIDLLIFAACLAVAFAVTCLCMFLGWVAFTLTH